MYVTVDKIVLRIRLTSDKNYERLWQKIAQNID